jgi:hypothetical protein
MKTAAILALTALALATGCATFPAARRNTCINNMRILSAATDQAAMECDLKNGDVAPRDEISSFIKNGIDSLRCPAGGVYECGIVGTDPKCSIHGALTVPECED